MFKFTETPEWKFFKAIIDILAPLIFLVIGGCYLFISEPNSIQSTNGLLYIIIGMMMWRDK